MNDPAPALLYRLNQNAIGDAPQETRLLLARSNRSLKPRFVTLALQPLSPERSHLFVDRGPYRKRVHSKGRTLHRFGAARHLDWNFYPDDARLRL